VVKNKCVENGHSSLKNLRHKSNDNLAIFFKYQRKGMGRCCREKPQGKEVSLQENSIDKNENEKFNYFVLFRTILFSNGFIVEVCGHCLGAHFCNCNIAITEKLL
jgi:hypothetical protein